MKKIILTGLAATALLAGPAMAQSTTTAATPAMMAGGMQMADRATMPVKFVAAKPADLMSSKLVGTEVYDNQNDKLGQIEDLVIDNGKSVTGVVVSVGGFLGIGERYVLIDPASMAVSDTNGTMKAFVDTSKDTLKNAPAFTYSKKNA
jgi:sporulation protein YlmC with PRC-barrel domain